MTATELNLFTTRNAIRPAAIGQVQRDGSLRITPIPDGMPEGDPGIRSCRIDPERSKLRPFGQERYHHAELFLSQLKSCR